MTLRQNIFGFKSNSDASLKVIHTNLKSNKYTINQIRMIIFIYTFNKIILAEK